MRPSTLQVAFENLQLLSLTSSTPQDGCCHVHHNLLNSSETKTTLGMCPEFCQISGKQAGRLGDDDGLH
jgi:hypothetical protein